MNVPTVKLFCWLTSAGLTAGLVGYAYDFFSNIKEKRFPLDRDHVESILNESAEHSGIKVQQGIDYNEVKRTFIHMNWTGHVAPPEVVVENAEPEALNPIYAPVNEILTIVMISVDTSNPSTSTVLVNYIGAGIESQRGTLKEGEPLPSPHQGVKVSSIRIDGVEFEFDQEGRDNETIQPSTISDETVIIRVGPDGIRYRERRTFPTTIDPRPPSYEHTTLIGDNQWRIGIDDAKYFNENYAAILTYDVRTETYYDEKGRRAGIEIKSIKAGSVAANHGIQSGDIIKSVNGHAVTSEHEAIKFFKTNQDKYSVWSVVVESMGKEKTLIFESPE